jgi:hypothetical protein
MPEITGVCALSPPGHNAGLYVMFDSTESLADFFAATQIAPVALPKVKPGTQTFPSYLKTTKPSDSVLPQADRRLASTDTTTLRNGASTWAIIRDFVAASPDLSAAVWAYARLGLPEGFTAVAKNPDNTFNREATMLVQQLVTRFNLLPDYTTDGFTGPQSVRATSESLAREIMMYGSCAGEVVLGKDRLPKRIQPISTTQIKFIADKDKTLVPWQHIGDAKINLDYPTFIYVALDQDLLEPYSASPIESSIKPVIYSEQFSNDITRIVGKVIHPRQKVRIDEERVRKFLSPEAQVDNTKAVEELNAITSSIESKINSLAPEDALVYLDSLEFEVENASNSGLSAEYTVLQDMANARLSTGSKTNGTVLGFASGSSNIASSEIMLFMRSCTGAIKGPIEEFWSRALTLSARLFGFDVVVKFTFDPIDLRPDNELLAFKQTKQMIILEQLSLGMISDDEACLQLTGSLAPPGMKPLSGSMFRQGAGAATDTAGPSNSGSTLNQKLKPATPSTGRGQNKKAKVATAVEAAKPGLGLYQCPQGSQASVGEHFHIPGRTDDK